MIFTVTGIANLNELANLGLEGLVDFIRINPYIAGLIEGFLPSV